MSAAAAAVESVRGGGGSPLLSLVVVVHDMPAQATNTLVSLSPAYQRGVSASDYEVIVVENRSARLLGEEAALASGPNVRYFLRDDGARSPVFALNFGAARARGRALAMLIDGARLLSPGVVDLALVASRAHDDGVLAVPGYHLGRELQQRAALSGYDEAEEARLLESIDWRSDGYRLFDVACFSGSCAGGFLKPFAESNCVSLPRRLYEKIGGFDEGFLLPGGGFSNLDFYGRVSEHPDVRLFVAPGEGTFHQFHGGITTGGRVGVERDELMKAYVAEYESLRKRKFQMPTHEMQYLGRIPTNALRFLAESLSKVAG